MSLPGESSDATTGLRDLVALEREAREGLIRAREELLARDERFAMVEADLWAGFEDRERGHRERLARCEEALTGAERQLAQVQADNVLLGEDRLRLQVRLERIINSAPVRVYRSLQDLPGLRGLRALRTRGYEAAVAARRRS
jgi:hypothetical protein